MASTSAHMIMRSWRRVTDKPLQKFVTLVSTAASGSACVRFIDYDQLRTRAQKLRATSLALDVVETDDSVCVRRKDALARRQMAFEPRGTRGRNRNRAQVKSTFELTDPLLDEVWRAKDSKSFDIATIEQLTSDKRGLDRLANAHIVGNE